VRWAGQLPRMAKPSAIPDGAIEPQAVTTQTGSLDEAPVRMHAHVHGGETKTILGER
jgi:hypothetical protein